jgi:hypothetical protein
MKGREEENMESCTAFHVLLIQFLLRVRTLSQDQDGSFLRTQEEKVIENS